MNDALTAALQSVLRKALVTLGTVLVTHHFLTPDVAKSAIDSVVPQIAGWLMIALPAAWGWVKARANARLVAVAAAAPAGTPVVDVKAIEKELPKSAAAVTPVNVALALAEASKS